MSSANVDLARKGLEAFNRRDVDEILETLDPDVEMIPLRAVLEGKSYSGREEFRAYLSEMEEDWEDFTVASEDLRELDADRVLVLGRIRARARGSGVEVDFPAAWISQIKDGRVVRVQFYSDEAHALEAEAAR